jgi:transposase
VAQRARDRLQARRLRAAELFAAGVRQAEVARQLGVSAQAVSVWHARWKTGGTDAVHSRGPSGSAPRLSDAQLATVAQALLDGANLNGFTGALWTLDRIAIVIERLTGVRRHSAHVWALLDYRLGYGAAMMTSTLRVSNAKAKADLGWEPSVPTYREGIARVVEGWRTGRSPAEGPA